MNVAVIIIVVVAVCCVLGGAKSKNVRKRKPKAATPRKSPAQRAIEERGRELREQAKRQRVSGRNDLAAKSLRAADRQSVEGRKAEVLEEFKRQYRTVGTDLGMISSDCGEKGAPCSKWHGRIISVLGRTAGWPTLADVDAEAVFGGELPHRVEYVDELLDADEIARQKSAFARMCATRARPALAEEKGMR